MGSIIVIASTIWRVEAKGTKIVMKKRRITMLRSQGTKSKPNLTLLIDRSQRSFFNINKFQIILTVPK